MKTAFVTCLYDNLINTKFGGRPNRFGRYTESLKAIADCNVDIFCFISNTHLEQLKNIFVDKKNVTFIVQELDEFLYHDRIQELKNTVDRNDVYWQHRCVEIMWGKFLYIQRVLELEPTLEKVYWIDAGLSHRDVISPKYTDSELLEKHITERNYLLFTPKFIEKLNNWVGDKIFMILATTPHSKPIAEKYNNVPYDVFYGATGGFFGGDVTKMKTACNSFFSKVDKLLDDAVLMGEEHIMAGVRIDNIEDYKIFTFDSWHHEGWGDWYNPNLTNYSNFFDQVLAYE